MKAVKTKACNGVLLGQHLSTPDHPVFDLHIQRLDAGIDDTCNSVRSFWKPSDEEMLVLCRGGYVMLDVLGVTHPPLRIIVTSKD